MKVIIAGDHHTVALMKHIESFLGSRSIDFENVGSMDPDTKVALQQIVPEVAAAIQKESATFGILVCGTGAGVEIGANRFRGVRASLCTQPKQAEYARVYDDANVLCLSSWLTEDPSEILAAWFDNEFDGSESRAQMIKDFDTWR